MKIRVGSRESRLAVIQSQIVMEKIKEYNPDIELELVTMKTTGDIILDRTLDKIGGKGLFVKELDRALRNNEVDITVHSGKDVPMEVPEDLPLVAFSKREDPRDVLVLPKGIKEIDFSKPIGCSSARRRVQLKKIFPNCTVMPVRGNILTRLEKLDRGEYSALVLAKAGIKRLGLEERISREFSVDEIIPAACQGILAVQARKGFNTDFLKCFNDEEALNIALAERSFVKTLDGGCSSPVAAYADITGDKIEITGMYVDESENIFIKKAEGNVSDGEKIAQYLAKTLKTGGAGK